MIINIKWVVLGPTQPYIIETNIFIYCDYYIYIAEPRPTVLKNCKNFVASDCFYCISLDYVVSPGLSFRYATEDNSCKEDTGAFRFAL